MRKFHCVSLGCSENALDGSLISTYLEGNDWEASGGPENADLIIVNSCGFTEDAERGSLDTYRDMMARKREGTRVIFAGCLPAINKKAVREAGYDDVLVTPRRLHLLDSVIDARVPIDQVKSGCVPVSADNIGISFSTTRFAKVQWALKRAIEVLERLPGASVPRWLRQFRYIPDQNTEFVRISVGCMNDCSFCSIPRAKGWTKSVPAADVVAAVRDAVSRGKKSLALSCEELASYGQDLGTDIVALLDELTQLPEQFDLVLRNVHPEWMLKYWEKLKPSLRRGKIAMMVIPVQSGCDRTLAAMNRNHTARDYRKMLEELREIAPEVSVRTHIIAGFPGETDEDFRETLAFVKALPIDSICIHAYSERSFTPSARLPDKVPEDVIRARVKQLDQLDPVHRVMVVYWRLHGWAHSLRARRPGAKRPAPVDSSQTSKVPVANDPVRSKPAKRSLPIVNT